MALNSKKKGQALLALALAFPLVLTATPALADETESVMTVDESAKLTELDPASELVPAADEGSAPSERPVPAEQQVGVGVGVGESASDISPATDPAPFDGAAAPMAAAVPSLAQSGGTKRLSDVNKKDQFYTPIMWMYQSGLTTGNASPYGSYYAPKGQLSRAAMAAFLYRQAGSPSFTMPASGFNDVPASHKFYTPIMWMKASGLSTGTRTPWGANYEPSAPLSREAMAAFLYRQAGKPKVSKKAGFIDVNRRDTFYTPIIWMQSAGLTTGFRTDSGVAYKSKDSLSREAMAAFLYRQAGKPAFVDSGSLTIGGTAKTGQVLSANAAGWAPSTTKFSYQWLREGRAIGGATAAKYTVVTADAGKRLQVKVTGKSGTFSVGMTSASVTTSGGTVKPPSPTFDDPNKTKLTPEYREAFNRKFMEIVYANEATLVTSPRPINIKSQCKNAAEKIAVLQSATPDRWLSEDEMRPFYTPDCMAGNRVGMSNVMMVDDPATLTVQDAYVAAQHAFDRWRNSAGHWNGLMTHGATGYVGIAWTLDPNGWVSAYAVHVW